MINIDTRDFPPEDYVILCLPKDYKKVRETIHSKYDVEPCPYIDTENLAYIIKKDFVRSVAVDDLAAEAWRLGIEEIIK